MSTAPSRKVRAKGEPAWEVAHLFPLQGAWTESEYLALTDSSNHPVEFSNGCIEVLPVPTLSHQTIVALLYQALLAFVKPNKIGEVFFNGLRVRLWRGKFREPDIVFMLTEHADRMGERYFRGADLVMEVVSGGAEDRK